MTTDVVKALSTVLVLVELELRVILAVSVRVHGYNQGVCAYMVALVAEAWTTILKTGLELIAMVQMVETVFDHDQG